MTWFRVGGAGIPASLKNAMNAVFNKKFGTSGQNYPPNQWPDDVNLLGPLPEGTASGSIANFSDGTDRVPTKNVIATIAPTLSGVSTIMETQTGKTIFYPMNIEQGSISGSGFNSDSIYRIRTAERKAVTPSTEYKIKVNSEVQIYEVHEYTDLTGSSTHLTVNASEYTFTTKSTTHYLKILFRYSNNTTITPSAITELQVTDGELYWKTYIANLGRTIYGGSADLVNGTGTEKNSAPLTFDGSEDWRADTTRNGVYLLFSTMGTQTYGDGVCNMFTTIKAGSGLNSLGICFGINNYAIYIPHLFDGSIPEVTDVATWQTYLSSHDCTISYPLATQIDFTFDGQEINSLYGVNNFWNDAGGDTTVVYRRDIDLALQAVSNNRGLVMASRPVTQLVGEESDPDQVNELVENDETEQEGDNDAR